MPVHVPCSLTITNATNITLMGEHVGGGATIRMHRDTYLDPDKYKHSEYRHGLVLCSPWWQGAGILLRVAMPWRGTACWWSKEQSQKV